jgi:uncharacterized phage protein (TIGR01671 family)
MKREIKFRAWDVDNKEFVEEFEITHDGYVRLNYMDGDYFDNFKPKSNLIAMQYVGLKDKNGVEIYEGDIVAYQETIFHYLERKNYKESDGIWVNKIQGKNTNMYGVEKVIKGQKCEIVKWQEDETGFYPFADSPENCGHCGGGIDGENIEVIGNIYQNKELIK